MAFDPDNASQTSGRRMEEGAIYNFAVSFFCHYILGYALNRIFRRPILWIAPAFRRPKGNLTAARVAHAAGEQR